MIVIVTGPDRAGKTTLVNNLRNWVNFDVYYKGVAPKSHADADDALWELLMDKLQNSTQRFLCDRLPYPDDLIYSPIVVGSPNPFITQALPVVERVLRSMSPFFIHVTCPLPTLRQRWKDLGEDSYVTLEQNEAIWSDYHAFFKNTSFPHTRIDTYLYSPDECAYNAFKAISNHYGEK